MYLPTIFDDTDDFFDAPLRALSRIDRDVSKRLYGRDASRLMKTDVKDEGDHYAVAIDIPGFKKEEIKISLENGYLTVEAEKGREEEKKEEGKFLRRERYCGSLSRTYYVGDEVKDSDIHAKFEDGILRLQIPKKEGGKEKGKTIAIE